MKKNLISVGALEALGHEVSIRDGVLKMSRGLMVVLKGVRCNNLYYLMGSMWRLLFLQMVIAHGL